ncbi:MAG: hypothetical protein K2J78_08605 [Muribaculaceae bacterium]|nr:hypothetical protein [Muribaculaceae bacterium]MDE6769766.1 hypothetical protein [Muribaculaceae bacterium]
MDTNTFALLVKKELVDNRKPLVLGLIGIWATYILLGAFLGYVKTMVPVELFLFCFFGGMILTIGASLAFNNMKSKEGRINTIMLPVPVHQKFIVRWLATVPLLLIVVLIGCLLGDWARIVVYKLMLRFSDYSPAYDSYYVDTTAISFIITNYVQEREAIGIMLISGFWGVVCSQAIYFLGSVVWPKLSFIKTWAAMQVLGVIFAMVFVPFLINIKFDFAFDLSYAGLLWIINIVGLLFCIGIYWLSYERFKRSQVIYKLF